MAADPQSEPSFSPSRRWGIAFHVAVSLVAVLAVVILANYLSQDWFSRLHWTSRSDTRLSPLSLQFVRSITNNVKVTLFYDREEPLFTTISDLLHQYQFANPRITVQAVDYIRDLGAALKVRETYKNQLLPGQKDVIIFDCGGRQKIFPGKALTKVTLKEVPHARDAGERRQLTEFEGEKVFTSFLLAVTSTVRPRAYYVEGHGEHALQSGDLSGYMQFLTILRQNNIEVESLDLLGPDPVPADCSLLIIAGPQTPLADSEVEKVNQYLNRRGRLFVLFRSSKLTPQTGAVPANGLEHMLREWGVEVGDRAIRDPQSSPGRSANGYDFVVSTFSTNPVVNPLIGHGLYVMLPRTVSRLKARAQEAEALHVDEIAYTSETAIIGDNALSKHSYPIMAAVDATIKGVTSELGSTRLVVAGDSFFLGNQFLAWEPNRDFVTYAANWLLDRPQLIDAIPPRPVSKFLIIMTKAQLQTTQLLLMMAMPAAVMLLGGVVWFRRRQ